MRNRGEYFRVAHPFAWIILLFSHVYLNAHNLIEIALFVFLFVSISFVSIGTQIIVQIEIDLTNRSLLLLYFLATHTRPLFVIIDIFCANRNAISIEPFYSFYNFRICLFELRLQIAYFIIQNKNY